MTAIPLTAWEQAGIVVLFLVAIIFVLNYVARQDANRRAAEDKRNKTLMDFIERRDQDWQGFLREIRDTDCKRQDATRDVLTKLTELLAEHDQFAHIETAKICDKLDQLSTPKKRITG